MLKAFKQPQKRDQFLESLINIIQKKKINIRENFSEPENHISIIVPLFIPYFETFDSVLSKKYRPQHITRHSQSQSTTYHFYFTFHIKAKKLVQCKTHLKHKNAFFYQERYRPGNTFVLQTFNNKLRLKKKFNCQFTFEDLRQDLNNTFQKYCKKDFLPIDILTIHDKITYRLGSCIAGFDLYNIPFLQNVLTLQSIPTLNQRSLPEITQLIICYLGFDHAFICFSNLLKPIARSALFHYCVVSLIDHRDTHYLTRYILTSQLIKITQSLIKQHNLNNKLLNHQYPQFNFTLPTGDHPTATACQLLNHRVRRNRYSPQTFKHAKITSRDYHQLWQLLQTITPGSIGSTSLHTQISPSLLIPITILASLFILTISFRYLDTIFHINPTSSLQSRCNITAL